MTQRRNVPHFATSEVVPDELGIRLNAIEAAAGLNEDVDDEQELDLTEINALVGDGLDTFTVTSTGIQATDTIRITIEGVAPVTLTAIANGIAPGANEFAIGTGDTIDDTTAANIAAKINALAATTLPGCVAVAEDHVVTVTCTKYILAEPSGGDEAKVVIALHTTASNTSTISNRLMQQRLDIEAIEASDVIHKARTTVLETAVRDGLTITVDAAVDTNTFKLNTIEYTFGAGGIGAAVIEGTAGERNQANAQLIATALGDNDDVLSATALAGVVTVVGKAGRVLVISDMTATRLVNAYTAPTNSIYSAIRTILVALES